MRSVFFIAFRYLWSRRGGGGRYLLGAAFAIALSLVPILVTLIVADGMIRGITDRFIELGTGHIQVWDLGAVSGETAGLDEAALVTAEAPGVRAVWRERQGMGIILGSAGRTGANIRAIESSFWEDAGTAGYLETIAGEARITDEKDVLLGESLAREAGAEVGKTIRLMTIRVNAEGRSIPRTTLFTVRGIVSSGYHEIDSQWCLVSYEAGEKILNPGLSYAYLTVKTDDPYKESALVAARINAALGAPYRAFTWKELQSSQYASYESTRQLLLFIMALIVLVAAVNVSSSTSMLVIERRRDIAVLKAFGLSPSLTGRVFLAGAALAGLTGAALGVGAGLCLGVFINQCIGALEKVLSFFSRLFHGEAVRILDPGFYLEKIPIIIDWKTVFLIAAFTVAASILASALPARHAGKQKPASLLRKY